MKIEHITMFYVIKIYVSNSILFIKINIFKIYIYNMSINLLKINFE